MDYEQRVKGHVCIAFYERILRFWRHFSLSLFFWKKDPWSHTVQRMADLGLSFDLIDFEAELDGRSFCHEFVDWCFLFSLQFGALNALEEALIWKAIENAIKVN